MTQELHEIGELVELSRLIYHDDKRAIDALRKRLSADADQDQLGALVADEHYVVQVNWDSPDYAMIVSDVRKLRQCSGLSVNWTELRKLAVWLDKQERQAGDYWSVSFVKILTSALARHGLEVLLIRDDGDPDWAAMAFPSRESARRVGELLSHDGTVDTRWTIASEADWDSPKAVVKKIQRRLAAIIDTAKNANVQQTRSR